MAKLGGPFPQRLAGALWVLPPAPGGGGQVGTAPRQRRDPRVRVGAGGAPRVAGRREEAADRGAPGAPRPDTRLSAARWAAGLSPRRGEAGAALCTGSSQVLGDASGDVRRRGAGGTGAARCSGAGDALVLPSGERGRGDPAGLRFSSLVGSLRLFFKSDGREHAVLGSDLPEGEGDGNARLPFFFFFLKAHL